MLSSPFILIASVFIFLAFLILVILLQRKKERGLLTRGMNLALFLVTLPQGIEKEKEISLQGYLKVAEQFYSSLAGIREKSWVLRSLIGNPVLVFEIAVHRIGEEIYFYVACPRSVAQLVEKQILGFWPKAQVQPVPDYNIFNPVGNSTGSQATLVKSAILPLKSSKEFGTDPLSAITSVFTKLAREGEGAAVQILIRPSQRPMKKFAQNVVNLLEGGIKLEEALRRAEATSGMGGLFRGLGGAFSSAFLAKPKKRRKTG